MKIRGRLIVSFSILIIMILSVFGFIIYMSFSESISEHDCQVLAYKTNDISLKLDMAVKACKNDMKLFSLGYDLNKSITSHGAEEQAAVQKILEDHLKARTLLSSIYILPLVKDRIIKSGRPIPARIAQEIKGLHSKNTESFLRDPLVVKVENRIFMVYLPLVEEPLSNRYLLAYEINTAKLQNIALSSIRGDTALLVASKDKLPVLEIYNSKTGSLGSVDIKSLLGNIRMTVNPKPTMTDFKDFHVFSSFVESLGWNLTYIVPTATHLSDLETLKNRIIVAIVIVFWVSIWIVLIISYTISKPLEMLSRAARDMMALNYETPIEVTQTKGEIRDLADSFESMRLKIKDLVLKDHLTNLYNRRYLMQFLESEISKADRSGGQLSVLMIDIDYFKSINDTYGHDCGDRVLIEIGRSLTSMVREYDVVARYGGEEFVVVMPDIDVQEAHIAAERIRKGIEASESADSADIKVTISIGLSSYKKDELDTPDKLINAADIALYQAKESGRNQTIVFAPHMIGLTHLESA